MPIDPVTSVPSHDPSPTAPPYVDEDVNLALVEEGMDVADSETRDAVADAYEATARLSDDPDEALDDIDYEKDEETGSPELDAIHEDLDAEAADEENFDDSDA